MNKPIKRHLTSLLLLVLVMTLCVSSLVACKSVDKVAAQTTESTQKAVDVNVATLRGPTTIGLINFMTKAQNKPESLKNKYLFNMVGVDTVDQIIPGFISGQYQFATLPANVAATLYNKPKSKAQVININTLGVLYVVTADSTVNSLEDLAGRTVLMTGKGTTPDYVFNYLLKSNGLSDKVNLEYKSEATELAATISNNPEAIALLPEPYVTAVIAKAESLAARINLTEVWEQTTKTNGAEGSRLVTGVTLVNADFAAAYPDVVKEFLAEQATSVLSVNADPAAAAQGVVDSGLIANVKIAEKAIPNCNLVCLSGKDMKTALSGYLQVLYDQDPKSVGGKMPKDDFYLVY